MIKILVADDHPVVRNGLKQIISDEKDMKVTCEASNAEEVFDALNKNEVDIVILDISMPNVSGMEILTKIKNIKPKLPVLMLSALSEDVYASRCLKVGASGFISKETAPEELVKAVRKIMSGGLYVSSNFAEKLAEDVKGANSKSLHERLSEREFQIMLLIGSGKSVGEIAEQLFISVKTVSTYRARILEKMAMDRNSDIINYCIKENLIQVR